MPIRCRAAVVFALLVASPSGAARFADEAERLSVRSLVALDDGGWAVAGTHEQAGGPAYGLLIRADSADRVLWARRADDNSLTALARLPDGGLLVGGGRGLLSRLDAAGDAAWEAEIGAGEARVQAVSCRGWDCVAAGGSAFTAFVLRLDALTGEVAWEVNADALASRVAPSAILMLAGGDILLGATIEEEDFASAASIRLDASGTVLWAWNVTGSWVQGPDAFVHPRVRALLERTDGRTLALAENAQAEPTLLEQGADGLPLAALDWSSSAASAPTSALLLPSGRVLVGATWGASATLLDPTLGTLEGVLLGPLPASHGAVLLARPPSGDIVVTAWPNVGRLAIDLSRADGCLLTSPAAFPPEPGPVPPRATPREVEFPERDRYGLRPASPSLVPACLGGRCLLDCEADCTNGLDDDADGLVDCDDSDCASDPACGDADPDGDGVPNRSDCRAGDGLVFQRPPSLTTLRVDKGGAIPGRNPVVRWQGTLPPFAHWQRSADVLRGRLEALRAEGNTLGGTCVARGRGGSLWYDREAGAARDDYWYLVRPWNACGPGPWDRAELDAGLGGCP